MQKVKQAIQSKLFEKIISFLASFYVIFGLIFALYYAVYYHWSMPFSLFSPPFFSVLITWPFQIPGFLNDILLYGPGGKLI